MLTFIFISLQLAILATLPSVCMVQLKPNLNLKNKNKHDIKKAWFLFANRSASSGIKVRYSHMIRSSYVHSVTILKNGDLKIKNSKLCFFFAFYKQLYTH